MSFKNHHVIITGGSSGIGKAVARLLVHEGAHLTIIARNTARLATAKAELEAARLSSDQKIHSISADVSDEDQAYNALDEAVETIGPPDILICNAGFAEPGRFIEQPASMVRYTMEQNFFSAVYITRRAAEYMAKRGSGHIVLTSSGAALIGVYGYSAYTPSKIALRGFAECLRAELKPLGIAVSIIYPADTQTPQLDYENQTKPEETRRCVHDPLLGVGPVWKTEDVARVIVRGIKKKKFSIPIGWQLKLMVYGGSMLVPFVSWWYDRIIRKVQRERTKRQLKEEEQAKGASSDR
ncbi:MAG: 3-ketodihydrosphingosine reductase [Herpetosiphonaceae bacterium]|nr:MAG: 3-ketodihydrosphingosine reductase [Herpetosiphonaceae bacterium]